MLDRGGIVHELPNESGIINGELT
jgi:hypothetical protein